MLFSISRFPCSLLIGFVEDKPTEEAENDFVWKGYIYAVLLFVAAFFSTLFMAQYSHRMYMTGLRARTVLVSAIYRKALVVSNAAKRSTCSAGFVHFTCIRKLVGRAHVICKLLFPKLQHLVKSST